MNRTYFHIESALLHEVQELLEIFEATEPGSKIASRIYIASQALGNVNVYPSSDNQECSRKEPTG